ncbi:MAG TPA: hypothetical protein VNM72_11985 [Blastocatellia bacterium]|nr:hypothetical protein [Blastocatellia bacterium]
MTAALVAALSSSPMGQGRGRRVIDLAVQPADITLVGEGREWELGASVATGDVNGDSVPDLIVGAPGAAGPDGTRVNAGQVVAFFSVQGKDEHIDTRLISPDLIVYGSRPRDRLGDVSALAVGDVNGDRLDDLILGARSASLADDSRRNPGAVYVIFGRPGLGGAIDLATTPADLTIYGADSLDWLGQTVTVADLNNDGKGDLIVGAPLGDGPDNTRTNSGEVDIIFGGAHLGGVIDLAVTRPDAVIYGADADDFLGTALATGDLNGDGRKDLAVTSLGGDGPGNGRGDMTGEVSIVFAGEAFPPVIDLKTLPSWILYGRDPGDFFGFRILAQDLSNDGVAELIVSAPRGDGPRNGRTSAGEVIVISGTRTAGGVFDLAKRSPTIIVYGANVGDELGFQVGLRDFTGDTIRDLVLAAPGGDGPNNGRGEGTGEVVVVSLPKLTQRGLLPALSVDLATQAPFLTIYGSQRGETLGFSLLIADITEDGEADLLMGARTASPTEDRPRAGRIYVLTRP